MAQKHSEKDSKQDILVKVLPGLFRQTAMLPTTDQLKWQVTPLRRCLKMLKNGPTIADAYQALIARHGREKLVHR